MSQNEVDDKNLKKLFYLSVKNTLFPTFVIMSIIVANSELIIISLLGEKWSSSVLLLQILCFEGMIFPLTSIIHTILKLKDKTSLILYSEIIIKLISVIIIIYATRFDISGFVIVLTLLAYFNVVLTTLFSRKYIEISLIEILNILTPLIFLSSIMIFSMLFVSSIEIDIFIELIIKFLIVLLLVSIYIVFFNKELIKEIKLMSKYFIK